MLFMREAAATTFACLTQFIVCIVVPDGIKRGSFE